MTRDLLAVLSAHDALREGHFRLSSGRHSDRFVQKFRLMEDPRVLEPIAADLAARIVRYAPSIVVSAAVGGIVLGYEVARQLRTKAIFTEKEAGSPALRRGFLLPAGVRVAVVEDVITTGGSVREVMDVVRRSGAEVAVVGALVRRAPVDFGVPTEVLLDLPIESFEPNDCPSCRRGVPLEEPGSRSITQVS